MEHIIHKINNIIESIENTDNYEAQLKLYKTAKDQVENCEKKILNIKKIIENPNSFIESNIENYTISDDSETSVVPTDYTEIKSLLDKNEIFDYYIKRLREIENLYETKINITFEEKLDLYIESFTIIKWCKSYLAKKDMSVEMI